MTDPIEIQAEPAKECLRMCDRPLQERPRERLLTHGANALSTAELVAILLRTGRKGRSVIDIAHDLISHYGSLSRLAQARLDDLLKFKGVGPDKAATLMAAFSLAQRIAGEVQRESPIVDTAELTAKLLRDENRDYVVEYFQVVLLNARRRLIRVEKVTQGGLDEIHVHAREVFRAAISANAAALILVHNHPSGDPTPSDADTRVTRDLIRAGHLLKIEVIDHVILGRATAERPRDYVSLRELGFFFS